MLMAKIMVMGRTSICALAFLTTACVGAESGDTYNALEATPADGDSVVWGVKAVSPPSADPGRSVAEVCAGREVFSGEEQAIFDVVCAEFVASMDSPDASELTSMMGRAFRRATPGAPPALPGSPRLTAPEDQGGSAGIPMPGVSTDLEPCDFPSWEIDIGVGNGVASCNSGERDFVRSLLPYTKFFVWRARQAVQAVLDEPDDAAAAAMWSQGADPNLSPETWFGTFNRERARVVLETYDEVWDTLRGEYTPGKRMNIQCWKRMKPWDIVLSLLFNPARILYKMIANPCAWDTNEGGFWAGGEGNAGAHTWYVWAINITEEFFLYPFYSFELCGGFFNDFTEPNAPDPVETNRRDRAATIIHELLHHEFNETGLVKDKHKTPEGICLPGDDNQRCYREEECIGLAATHPNEAVVNNSSYQHFAEWIGRAYLNGWCDDVHNPLCFPSECCGNNFTEPAEGEICDGTDLDGHSCNEFGWTEGEVSCVDCQTIDPGGCFGICGNGLIDVADNEGCDGLDFGGLTCADYGFQVGFLSCSPTCFIETSGCSNPGPSPTPPSYDACFAGGCQSPEDCAQTGDAGLCLGGPCIPSLRTNDARTAGMTDPSAPFHPKGNFEDQSGNFYRCDEAGIGKEASCVDVTGWGVCKECSKVKGETATSTMIGCSCTKTEDCGPDQECWGGEFSNGGYCWPSTGPDSGPPHFQCEKGACGHELTGGADGGSYCEHYPVFASDQARCEPQRCTDLKAQECSGLGQICGATNQCINECSSHDDCRLPGWPSGWCCNNNTGKCEPGLCPP